MTTGISPQPLTAAPPVPLSGALPVGAPLQQPAPPGAFGAPPSAPAIATAPDHGSPGPVASLPLLAGVVGLAASGVVHVLDPSRTVDGALPACSLVLVLLGLAARFPTLLQDGTTNPQGTPNVSTMRVAVLLVVCVFSLVTVKAGWATPNLADLKIDSSWAWVLAAALGGKAAQSVAENGPFK